MTSMLLTDRQTRGAACAVAVVSEPEATFISAGNRVRDDFPRTDDTGSEHFARRKSSDPTFCSDPFSAIAASGAFLRAVARRDVLLLRVLAGRLLDHLAEQRIGVRDPRASHPTIRGSTAWAGAIQSLTTFQCWPSHVWNFASPEPS